MFQFNLPAHGSLFEMDSVRDSEFVNLKLTGPWTSGAALVDAQKAFELKGYSLAVMSNNNTFDNVEVKNYTYAWYSDYDIKNTMINNLKCRNLCIWCCVR